MKKFIAFLFIILYLTILCIFFTETTDVLDLRSFDFKAGIIEKEHQFLLSWTRLPYPAYYEVEVLTKNPSKEVSSATYHLVKKEFTVSNTCAVPPTAIPTYYRITAHGIFGIVGKPSPPVANHIFSGDPLQPTPISKYDNQMPASRMPFFIWHTIPGAVYYELEVLSAPPENPGGIELSRQAHLFSTKNVFINGYQMDLRPFMAYQTVYWRVRGLSFTGNPIGVFSEAQPVTIDNQAPLPQKPIPNMFDLMPDFKQPLYPVYNWIPMNNVQRYEVELLIHPPAQENNTMPSPDRIWYFTVNGASSCYDEYPRLDAGDYYWRVRAVDAAGNTIGVYSDSQKFTVDRPALRPLAATFGDSITHGGGSLSYSPANLEYSYQTYLDFPVLNLGHSGDTSTTTAARFEQDVLPFQPRNLIILCGSNSIRAETPAAVIMHDIDVIRQKCEANHIRPIFLTLMPINPPNIFQAFQTETAPDWYPKLQQVNAHIRQMPYYIDLEPYFYDTQGFLSADYSIDGLHPDINGKQLMAQIINAHMDLLKK